MASQTYCTTPADQFVNNPCSSEAGGIIAAGFIDASAYPLTDFESNSEWIVEVGGDRIYPVYYTRGEYPGGDLNVSDDGFGLADEIVLGGTHTVTYEHRGIHEGTGGARDNIANYNAFVDAPGQYYFYFVTSDLKMYVPDKPVTVKPRIVTPRSKKELEVLQVEVTWQTQSLPQSYDAPSLSYDAP